MPLSTLPSTLGVACVLAFLVFVVARAVWAHRQQRRAADAATAAQFGKRIARDRDMHTVASLYRWQPRVAGDGDDAYDLSDRTWRDLGLDAVFARLDRCVSPLGQQALYRYLRAPRLSLAPLEARAGAVAAFLSNAEARRHASNALRGLAGPSAASLAQTIFGPPAALPRGARLFPLATLATLGLTLACLWTPVAMLGLLVSIATNIAIRVAVFRNLSAHLEGVRQVAHLLDTARDLAKISVLPLRDEIAALRAALASLGGRRLSVGWLMLDRLRLDDMTGMVVEYANVFLLLDVNAYVSELAFARAQNASLARIFEQVAALDAALAISNYTAGERVLSRPELNTNYNALTLDGVCHPLVADAVPNDVTLARRGYIVTGSNMAGKSTFLKAVALQAVLAQSIYATTSARYSGPFVQVQTLVEIADDLLASRSHFRVEAEVALAMLSSTSGVRSLCIVDELFRGTNTADRIAAGAAFLSALHASGAFVLAATHDRELLTLLEGEYTPHHFSESVVGDELTFDYRLRVGAAAPRNALAVLKLVGFPEAVLARAREIARSVDRDPLK